MENPSQFNREEKIDFLLKNSLEKKKRISPGYFYIAPWFIGFILFSLIPMIMSLVMSFMDWPVIGEPRFVGFENFTNMFHDDNFLNSLLVTVRYAIVAVPIGMIASFTIALIMNSKIKGLSIYRTVYYLPAVVSGVAVGIIWRWILDPSNGLINNLLHIVGIQGPGWFTDPNWVLPSYIMISLWGAGAGMLTYLVALNEVPKDLYESASIQGANAMTRLLNITLPMMKPILYYNLIMGIIGAFKKFNDAYILGGAGNQGQFILLQIYDTAFKYFKMGYASAMSWVFLIIVLLITMLVLKFTDFWTYGSKQEE
ncbi:sugar ABC transporter permease [Bacillus sp. DX1.1]|uniref:carbohydrate ABC transporter permease n=1 Tax=unclassified Bacillus (in: firmicutes) TaxID=185979 RepID=UPI00256FE378|nr:MULTISPECIES: sugar ABC transporter permease [unclassified Bacillus (in: firmicutes)]MDM5153110.1 sugar ABC transporter permease [Bacillus sp. DX1.1]WJE82083.1 sugar ABC transporter permease [Bacillus sp. DX3.1]